MSISRKGSGEAEKNRQENGREGQAPDVLRTGGGRTEAGRRRLSLLETDVENYNKLEIYCQYELRTCF
jgi:hypothetical protein